MLRRLALTLAAAGALVGLAAAPAAASTAASFTSYGSGLVNAYDPTGSGTGTVAAGSPLYTVGSTQVPTFCTERAKPTGTSGAFTVQPATAAWAPRAAWLAANHATVATPLADANYEASATQLAIWAVQGDTLSTGTVPNATLRARAQALVAAAQSATLPAATAPAVGVAAARSGADASVTVTLSGADDVAGETVTVAGGGTTRTVTTNAAGVATTSVPATGATITASWTARIGAGALLVPTDTTKQVMITAAAASVEVQGSAPVPAVPATTTTVPPTTAAPTTTSAPTTAAPTTVAPTAAATASAPVEELPYTGTGVSPWLAVTGAALVGLALVAARSRRQLR